MTAPLGLDKEVGMKAVQYFYLPVVKDYGSYIVALELQRRLFLGNFIVEDAGTIGQ